MANTMSVDAMSAGVHNRGMRVSSSITLGLTLAACEIGGDFYITTSGGSGGSTTTGPTADTSSGLPPVDSSTSSDSSSGGSSESSGGGNATSTDTGGGSSSTGEPPPVCAIDPRLLECVCNGFQVDPAVCGCHLLDSQSCLCSDEAKPVAACCWVVSGQCLCDAEPADSSFCQV